MNRRVFLASVTCVLSLGVATQAKEMPELKAGLWESTVTANTMPAPRVIRQCIDDKTDSLVSAAMSSGNCKPPVITKTSAGYEIETSCRLGQGTASGRAVISGNFSSNLTAKIVTTVTAAPGQQPVTTNITIEAKYVGPCAADHKPSDIMMPNGKVIRPPAPSSRPLIQKAGRPTILTVVVMEVACIEDHENIDVRLFQRRDHG